MKILRVKVEGVGHKVRPEECKGQIVHTTWSLSPCAPYYVMIDFCTPGPNLDTDQQS